MKPEVIVLVPSNKESGFINRKCVTIDNKDSMESRFMNDHYQRKRVKYKKLIISFVMALKSSWVTSDISGNVKSSSYYYYSPMFLSIRLLEYGLTEKIIFLHTRRWIHEATFKIKKRFKMDATLTVATKIFLKIGGFSCWGVKSQLTIGVILLSPYLYLTNEITLK